MAADEITGSSGDVPEEPTEGESTSIEIAPQTPEEPAQKQGWSRRAFFQAAALGAAATAFLESKRFIPSAALAHIVTGVNCRANDVRIDGVGRIVNETCNCSGTFNAVVEIPIFNNTGTNRYCVTMHLCAGTLPNGGTYPARDIPLGTIPPGTTMATFTLPGFPCNAGRVCFGTFVEDGRTSCPSGCCTVISWETRPTDAPDCAANADPSPSKCRIQQVCVVGRGAALTCNNAGTNGNCTVACGGTATLTLCATGGDLPYTDFSLRDNATPPNTYDPISVNGNCATFSVVISQTTVFTGTVTDSGGCAQDSPPVTVSTQPVAQPTLTAGTPDCTGKVTLSISQQTRDANLTYTYQEVNCDTGVAIGAPLGSGKGKFSQDATFAPGQNAATRCFVVKATNDTAACDQTSDRLSVTFNASVRVTLEAAGGGCDGKVTFTATGQGGTGTYQFTFKEGTTVLQAKSSDNTLEYGPVLDGAPHTITVEVEDSAGCKAAQSASKGVTQCVETTIV